MVQKLTKPLEHELIGPHIRHPNPHPQYALAGSGTLSDDLPATEAVGAAGTPGVDTEASRADHQHPMPGLATASQDGFMSSAQFAALAAQSTPAVIAPLAGGLLDIDAGQLVWNIDNLEQVVDA